MLVFGAMVEVVSAEILVEGSRLEHTVGGGEQGGGYGSDGFFGAAAAAQAVVLSIKELSLVRAAAQAHCTRGFRRKKG
jgi:hypothetical protein